jgi:uncharacterized protein (TIGR00730 family)
MRPEKAYKNLDFLNSPEARAIRILCEYEEPLRRFNQQKVEDTIVIFGSARSRPVVEVQANIERIQGELANSVTGSEATHQLTKDLAKAKSVLRLSEYYEKTRELSRLLTEWDMNRPGEQRYFISTGGGPGMMEAANRGAADVPNGRSVGLAISLPFEESVNQYVTPELGFEFHYFFTRKYWFLYLCKAMVITPGGFGTLDELFETLTLRQTGKITKPMPTVLFGAEYWNDVMNIPKMVEWGTISEADLDMFIVTDDIEEAFNYIVNALEEQEASN